MVNPLFFYCRYRIRGHSLASPHKSQPLSSRRFHTHLIDINPHLRGKTRSHSLYIPHQFWRLSRYCHIHIHDRVSLLTNHLNHFPQQYLRVYTLEFIACIREPISYITKGSSAQYSIAQCMDCHIRIGMSKQSFIVWNKNTAQPEFSTLDYAVYIVSETSSIHYILYITKHPVPCLPLSCQHRHQQVSSIRRYRNRARNEVYCSMGCSATMPIHSLRPI